MNDSYLLSAAAIQQLASQPLQALQPVLSTHTEITPYTALDTFDQALRHAGQLLLSTQRGLELVSSQGLLLSQAVQGQAAFLSDIPQGNLKQAITHLSPLRRLLPIGEGLWQHAQLAFVDDEEKTHCRVHLVFLTAEPQQAIAVAAVQGLKGYDESLQLLRTRMQELEGGQFNGRALHETLFPGLPAYNAKPDIPLAADCTTFDAANSIISELIPVARANEAGVINDLDTEFLHDYRIQLRKIRSLLSLFKNVYESSQTARLKEEFSALMAPTGLLRDLDVYLLEKDRYYELLPTSLHRGLNALYEACLQRRMAEQKQIALHLGGTPYRQQIARLSHVFAQPAALEPGEAAQLYTYDYACKLIWKRYRKVSKIAAGIHAKTPDEQVHALRIQCKKLRYLMEFFGSMFPAKPFKKLLGSLKKLQENLGLFNDYSVQQTGLEKAVRLLPQENGAPDAETLQSVGALIAVLHGLQTQERARVEKSIARFNSAKTRQAFKQMFKNQDHT